MKVFVLGKIGGITHWIEDAMAGFRAAGHDVGLGITRNPAMHPGLERLLNTGWTGLSRADRIATAIRRFQPDLILAIVPHGIPLPILQRVRHIPGRPPLIGWIGDRFAGADRDRADLFDALAYTDTGMLDLHRRFGFRADSRWVPHAASPVLPATGVGSRQERMVFVANPTPHRRDVVGGVRQPMRIFGPGWSKTPAAQHDIHDRRIAPAECAAIYRTHLAVLNVRNEGNVVAGLNQRHFEPCLFGTPVIADDQPDLPLCFDPGREVLVYQDVAGLNELYARLLREPEAAARVGAAGRIRVLAEHTYAHRLRALAA